jgi:carbamoyl-phosphate synthase large subunit
VPNAERIFFFRHAIRVGFTIEEILNLTKIDRWFLVQLREIVKRSSFRVFGVFRGLAPRFCRMTRSRWNRQCRAAQITPCRIHP